MKIISPTARIVEDDLAKKTLSERLEWCGRLCYDSHDKIAPGSASKFLTKIASRGHNSVLEMASMGFKVVLDSEAAFTASQNLRNSAQRFLTCYRIVEKDKNSFSDYIYGSIRSLLEAYDNTKNELLAACLAKVFEQLPELTREIPKTNLVVEQVVDVHDYFRRIAVLFVVNRAVSHELIRHRPASFLQQSQRYIAYRTHVPFVDPRGAFSISSEDYEDWRNAMQFAEQSYKEALINTRSTEFARTKLPNATATKLLVYTNLAHWKLIFNLRTTLACDPSMCEVMLPLQRDFISRWPHIFGGKKN